MTIDDFCLACLNKIKIGKCFYTDPCIYEIDCVIYGNVYCQDNVNSFFKESKNKRICIYFNVKEI